jgi:branched-chain amino acid aminotransferase
MRIQQVGLSRISAVDFENIPFGAVFSDHMFVADYKEGQWGDYRIIPFGTMQMHPANLAIHYGQSIFEGMKATKLADGTPVLFRPEMHSRRLNRSARRMVMPEFPEADFLEALNMLVGLDGSWIPQKDESSLYIRPYMFATGETIGVKPSPTFTFAIITGPVGPYYSKPVSLLADEKYIRAAQGGVGAAKTAGNYAASMLATHEAQQKGFDQVLWLDAKEFEFVQEVGTMNIFFVIDGKIITPEVESGTILPGITRDTLLHLFKDNGYTVEERTLSMFEVLDAHKSGRLNEVFGSGTAAVISPVKSVSWRGIQMDIPTNNGPIAQWAKAQINGIRTGKVVDSRGWVQPVKLLFEPA